MPDATALVSVDPGIYILVIVQFIIGIFGIILNSFVLYVTIKYKQFRKLTNYLLCLICFYDAIYGTTGITPFIMMTGRWQMPLVTCYFLQSSSPFIVSNSLDLMLFLGLERLVSVLFPIWHYSKSKDLKNLSILIFSLCFFKNIYIFYFCYLYVLTAPNSLVFCQPSDVLQGLALTLAANIGLSENILTLIVYFFLFLTIKVRKIGNGNPGMGHQINQSIFMLIIIYLGFWLTNILFGQIIIPNLAIENATTKLFYSRLFVQVNRLATVLNAPVLYFSSSEYRLAFGKEIGRLMGRGQTQSTLTINTNAQHRITQVTIRNRNTHQQQRDQWQGQRRQPMINNMI